MVFIVGESCLNDGWRIGIHRQVQAVASPRVAVEIGIAIRRHSDGCRPIVVAVWREGRRPGDATIGAGQRGRVDTAARGDDAPREAGHGFTELERDGRSFAGDQVRIVAADAGQLRRIGIHRQVQAVASPRVAVEIGIAIRRHSDGCRPIVVAVWREGRRPGDATIGAGQRGRVDTAARGDDAPPRSRSRLH